MTAGKSDDESRAKTCFELSFKILPKERKNENNLKRYFTD